jgi:molybdate transport system regulatory protein
MREAMGKRKHSKRKTSNDTAMPEHAPKKAPAARPHAAAGALPAKKQAGGRPRSLKRASPQIRLKLLIGGNGEDGQVCYGVAQLLRGVDELGSLSLAAKGMGMAYSKAWRLMKECEAALGFELIARDGARGSQLSHEGKRMLRIYTTIEAEAADLAAKRFAELAG